jgi:hypothetical protein
LTELLFDPEDGGDIFSETSVELNGIHGFVPQKIEIFRTD